MLAALERLNALKIRHQVREFLYPTICPSQNQGGVDRPRTVT